MREILFRGLSGKGEFVYGDLRNDRKGTTAYWAEFSQRICWSKGNADCNCPVKNGTIGQYTGLTDKNGTKIFEGDKVNYYTTRWVSESACDLFGVDGENEFDAGGEVHRKYTGEIRFFPSVGFVIANVKMCEVYSDGEFAHEVPCDEWGKEKKISYKIMSETKTRCELIGNIHTGENK